MGTMNVRRAAVAGAWYPRTSGALTQEVDRYLGAASEPPDGEVLALVSPHAGIMFSGPVAAYAYKAASRGRYETVVLVGPSHFVAFEGVSVYGDGAFETPLGLALIDAALATELTGTGTVADRRSPHVREHSLEMQLPFLKRVLPDASIVPLLMGFQTRDTIVDLADALATVLRGRRVLLVASSDLSHYFDATTASALDRRVGAAVEAFDPDALLGLFESYPEEERGRWVACGGGPMIAVMFAARALGAQDARVLRYAHSGEISGDDSAVVGYLAAAIGRFSDPMESARPA